jgi:hypothetical protein
MDAKAVPRPTGKYKFKLFENGELRRIFGIKGEE